MRFSLGFVLAISLAGLQFVAIFVVVTTSYLSSERAMLSQARGLLSEAGMAASDHARTFLDPAWEAADLTSRIIEQGIISREDPAALERYLFQQLQTEPQIAGVFYGDALGNFVYVMHSDGPGPFRTKTVEIDGSDRTTELIWRTADFELVARTDDPADVFDPRKRPWYENARKTLANSWTEPYIFFSSQEPGITVSSPVVAQDGSLRGAVGVDIEIAEISDFLQDLRVGENGTAVILSEDGSVIAHPDPNQVKVQNEDGSLRFSKISDIDDPISRAAFANIDGEEFSKGRSQSNFSYQDDRYLGLFSPITDIALPWTIAVFAPEDDFIGVIKDNRARNIWIAAVISILTALAGLTLAELILRPVRAFAVRTSLVSQGEVSAEEPLPSTYRELRRANKTLINEIAQRRESEAKVQELNRDLSHFSRIHVMGQMATGLAHELSQPLTAITQNVDAAISTASQRPNENSDLLGILAELDEQAHQGGDIIRALRGFVKRDQGEMEFFKIKELVSQTVRLIRHEAEDHGVKIDFDIGNIPLAKGNRVQIAQVLTNLMRNSIDAIANAESAQRQITITARGESDRLEIAVEDTGPGVPEGVKLFKQFQTSKSGGMGLGLSICRRIVELNGGRLWHDAESTDRTRFCFTVPVN